MEQKLFLKSSAHDLPQDHRFNGIDLFKFVGAVLICVIHIAPFQTGIPGLDRFNFYFQQYICRTAVPFYFVTSGFLLFRKMEPNDISMDRIKNYALRIARLLGVWVILITWGGPGHLWYLHSVVVAVLLVGLLLKKNVKLGAVLAVSFAFYVVGLFGEAYRGFLTPLFGHTLPKLAVTAFDLVFPNTRNGFFFGFVFVAMGALFAQKRIVMPSAAAAVGLLASLALLFFEVRWLRGSVAPKDYNLLLFLLPVAFFGFYLAAHLNLKDRPVYKTLRVTGLLLYLAHLVVDHFVKAALSLAGKVIGHNIMSLELFITVAVTLALGWLILKLSQTEKGQWLKYLYA